MQAPTLLVISSTGGLSVITGGLAIVAWVWMTMFRLVPDSNHVQATTTAAPTGITAAPISETDISMHKICSASERITRLPSVAGAGIAHWPTLFEVLALDVSAPPFNRPDGDDADARFVHVGKQEAQREAILRAWNVAVERIEREAVASSPRHHADKDDDGDQNSNAATADKTAEIRVQDAMLGYMLAQVTDTLRDDAARARYVWKVLPRMREAAEASQGGGWMANARPPVEGTPAHRQKMMEALVQICAGHGVVLGEA